MTPRDPRRKKKSRRQSFVALPNAPTSPPLHIRESVGRTIDVLQQLALRRPNCILLVESIVRAMISEKREDDPENEPE
jgi:hypothetical protein